MAALDAIVAQFPEIGKVARIIPLGAGLINQTLKVETEDPAAPDYILQCINNAVFQDVDMLQHNIECVTRHIRKKLEARGETDIDRKVLRSDVFVIEFHKLRFSVSGSKDTTNTPICRMVRYRVGKNV